MNKTKSLKSLESQFSKIVKLIIRSKNNAIRSANRTLIKLYWNIGKSIEEKVITGKWGTN